MSLTHKQADKIAGWIMEIDRLDDLLLPDLIHEVVGTDAMKHPAADECLRRLDPRWLDRYGANGEPLPESGLAPFPVEYTDTWSSPVPEGFVKKGGAR